MMSDFFGWLDDERLADAATSATPVWLFAIDGTRLLWSNLAAARLMGHATPAALLSRRFDDPRSIGGQLAVVARQLPVDGAPRLQRLRVPMGAMAPLVTCQCARLRRADGAEGILTVALDAPVVSGVDKIASARALVAGAPVAAAVLDGDGHVVAASDEGGRFVDRLFGLPEVAGELTNTMQVLKHQRHAAVNSSLGRIEFRRLGSEANALLLTTLDPSQALPIQEASRQETATHAAPAPAMPAPSETLLETRPDGVPLTPEQSAAGMGVDGADLGDILAAVSEVGDAGDVVSAPLIIDSEPITAPTASMPADSIIDTLAVPVPPVAPAAPRRAPLRFVFGFNAAGHLSSLSPELQEVVGSNASDLTGRSWSDIAARLGMDADGRVAQAIARRDTWSGITVQWPVAGTSLRLPVDLAAMPLFGVDRRYEGLRGFGLCRDLAALNAALAARSAPVDATLLQSVEQEEPVEVEAPATEIVEPETADMDVSAEHLSDANGSGDEDESEAADQQPEQAVVAPSAPDAAPPSTPPSAEVPADPHRPTLSVVPPSVNVVPFRVGEGKRPTLTPVEQQTFREIARQLGVRIETDPSAILDAQSEGVPATSTDAPAAPPVAETPVEPEKPLGTRAPTSVHDALALLGATVLKRTGASPATPAESSPPQAQVTQGAMPPGVKSAPTTPEATDEAADDDAEDDLLRAAPLMQAPPDLAEEAEAVSGQAQADPQETEPQESDPQVDDMDSAGEDPSQSMAGEPQPSASASISPALSPDTGSTTSALLEGPAPLPLLPSPTLPSALISPPPVLTSEPLVPVPLVSATAAASPAALQQSLSAALIDKLPLGVLVHRGDDILFANHTLLEWTGYDSTSMLRAAGGIEQLVGSMPETDDKASHSLGLLMKSGEIRPVDARLHSIPWDGQPSMAFVFSSPEPVAPVALAEVAGAAQMADQQAHEANQARQAAEAASRDLSLSLRESEARVRELSAILDTATDGVLVLDRAGGVRLANRSAEALFGIDAGEMIGRNFVELLAPESHGSARDYLDGLTANGVRSLLNDGREVIGKVRGGGLVPLFMTMGRLGETADSFCAVLRDVTAFKRAEDDLLAAKRQAETANAQKSDFLAKISHEIRTPLNAIIGFSEVMMEERFGPVGNERYREYLRDIHASGGHVLSLVNDLLDLSKIEAGKLDLTFTSVDLNDLIQQCVAIMQPQANRERTIIRTALARPMPNVVADSRSVRQIVLNLLSNSIKFTPAGGQVIVSTALTQAGEAVVRVRDTGVGMSDKDIATALEPFRQVATSSRFSAEGTGLGLPLTKALAEANRATFTIKSAVGQGTLVEIAFPPNRVLAG